LVSGGLIIIVGQLGRLPRGEYLDERLTNSAVRAAAHGAGQADVVVFGNSSMIFGIVPGRLAASLRLEHVEPEKLRVANLSTPLGTPAAYLSLWRRIAARALPPHPRLLIIGVTPISFADQGGGAELQARHLFRATDALWLARKGRVRQAADTLAYRAFPLYARRIDVRNLMGGTRPPKPMMPQHQWARLWRDHYVVWFSDFRVDPFQMDCLQQLIREANRRSVRVCLVVPPIGASLLSQAAREAGAPGLGRRPPRSPGRTADSSPRELFRKTMSQVVSNNNAVVFCDYMTLKDCLRYRFVDTVHMTLPSAFQFSTDLGRRLTQELQTTKPGPNRSRVSTRPGVR
jgi:hypothetical protein